MNKELTPLEALITIVEECKKQLIKENGYMKPTNNSEYKDDMVCGYPIQKIINSLKALEIIRNKRVDVFYFMNCKTLEEYNDDVLGSCDYNETDAEWRLLTQEEFDLLKEVLL